MVSFLHLLFKLLPHYILLNLSCYCQWVFGYKFNIFRNLVMGNMSCAMVENLMACNFVMFKTFYFNQGCYLLPKFLVRHSNHLHVLNAIHPKKIILDLFWINVFAASDNHILLSADYWQISMFVDYTQITRFHPSILNWFLSCVFISPILQHYVPTFC